MDLPRDTGVAAADTGAPPNVGPGEFALVGAEPATGARDVDPTEEVRLRFDGVIDEETSPSNSVTVTTDGGELDVELQWSGSELRVAPVVRWPLYADVTITLAADLTDDLGRTLVDAEAVTFGIREGDWVAEPKVLMDSGNYWTLPAVNTLGDVWYPLIRANEDASYTLSSVSYNADEQGFQQQQAVLERDDRPLLGTTLADDGRGVMMVRTYSTIIEAQSLRFATFDGTEWAVGPSALTSGTLGTFGFVQPGLGNSGLAVAPFSLGDGELYLPRWTLGVDTAPEVPSDPAYTGVRQYGTHPMGDSVAVFFYDTEGQTLRVHVEHPDDPPTVTSLFQGAQADINSLHGTGDGGVSFTWVDASDFETQRNVRYVTADDAWEVTVLGEANPFTRADLCANAQGARIAVFAHDGELVVRDAEADGPLSVERVVGDFESSDVRNAQCLLDAQGNGHVFFSGRGDGKVRWARFQDGGWVDATALPVPSAGYRSVTMDRYGSVNLYYSELDTDSLRVMRFE